MDNHESHITINSLEFSKENGIVVVTLPPHTSGKLQPLDKTVYNSLKTNYNITCNDWMLSNPGCTITIYDIPTLFNIAYLKAFTPQNIINGFRYTGIWPLNRLIFIPDDFLASYVTDRDFEVVKNFDIVETEQLSVNQPSESRTSGTTKIPQGKNDSTAAKLNTAQSETVTSTIALPLIEPKPGPLHQKTPEKASNTVFTPFQKALPRKNTTQRGRKRKSKILTDTPIKNELIEELGRREKKEIYLLLNKK